MTDVVTPKLIAFRGRSSQTGLAAASEFPGIDFQGASETFDEIADMLRRGLAIAALPMWNSHEGEITKSRVLELLFDNQAKLYRLWPKQIQFECISKALGREDVAEPKTIVSVGVAETQCSRFIKTRGASFVPVEATTVAYERFCEYPAFDAALCAPGQNKGGFLCLCADASNPMNFTSFALLACVESAGWGSEQWGPLHGALSQRDGLYCGVQMPISSVASEDQEALLTDLTADAAAVDDIPRVLFVAKRPPDRCGLLIESTAPILSWDILADEGYSTKITVNRDLGETASRYTPRIYDFLDRGYHEQIAHDFVRHTGTRTCFFACPPLRIITHGFEDHVVEPVVRRVILKYFELIDSGIGCSDAQREFFEKYKDAYYERGVDFITFVDVGL
jgi:hypothetical protein